MERKTDHEKTNPCLFNGPNGTTGSLLFFLCENHLIIDLYGKNDSDHDVWFSYIDNRQYNVLLPLQVKGQEADTVVMLTGKRLGVKVTGLKYDALDHFVLIRPFDDEKGRKIDHIRSSLVRCIEFADGFAVGFKDGELIRDNLTEAPSYKGRMGGVWAEGVIPLTRSESRAYLGDKVYETGFIPYRRQILYGISKTLVSVPPSLVILALKPRVASPKDLPPWRNLILYSGTVTAIAGITETIVSLSKMLNLIERPESFVAPSHGRSVWRVAAGSCSAAGGVGMLVAGHLNSGDIGLYLIGSGFLNVGLIELTYGINCLRAESALRGRASLSFVPQPGGGALLFHF